MSGKQQVMTVEEYKTARRPKARQPRPGKMNGAERQYAQYLSTLKTALVVREWYFEHVKLKLADKTYYTPDFVVITDEIEMREVKGFWRDDARVKIKIAAKMYPCFRFLAIKQIAKKDPSCWPVEEF